MPQELPEGFKLDQPTGLPPGFTLDTPKEKDNFFERFGDDLKFRFGEQGAEIINARVAGDQGFANTALQLTGVGAGSIVDFIGEALISGGRGLSNITPDFIEDPLKENATKAGMFLLNTELGQKGLNAAQDGVKAWEEFAEEHPVAARSIGAVVNISLLIAPVKAKPKTPGAGALTRAGQKLETSAARSTAQNKKNFAEELVTPAQSKKERIAQTSRTTEKSGPLKQKKVELSPSQKASAIEVEKLAISRKETLQGNLNIIRKATDAEAESLKKKLASLHVRERYKSKEFFEEMDAAFVRIKAKDPALVGDSKKAVRNAIDRMEVLAAQESQSLSGLLKARKIFDAEILASRGGRFFESETSNALQLAVREVRQTTNNFIAARAPQKAVRQSLDKQHRLHNAMKDIGVKAADEGNNRIIRGFRTALKLLPFRGEFNQFLAAIFGIGGLGASARFAPYFTKLVGLTGVTYVAGKAILRPGSRKGLAGLLTMIDRAVQRTTDPAVLLQLRTDRAAIVELLKSSKDQIKEDNK